uniref:ALOG domain-containing protein n=1 Tax=Leersia perrieri TaxID=77586 RepID=A0A0D9VII3_9ORYZ
MRGRSNSNSSYHREQGRASFRLLPGILFFSAALTDTAADERGGDQQPPPPQKADASLRPLPIDPHILMELSPNNESSPPTAGGGLNVGGGGDGAGAGGSSSAGGASSSVGGGGGGTPQTPSRYEAQKRRDWNTFGQRV